MAEREQPPAGDVPSTDHAEFKGGGDDADTSGVDIAGAPRRLSWHPVTDSGGQVDEQVPARSSFQFDLGGALARLGHDDPPPTADLRDPVAPAAVPPAPASVPTTAPPAPVAASPTVARSPATEVPVGRVDPIVPVAPVAPVAPVDSSVRSEPVAPPDDAPPLPVRGSVAPLPQRQPRSEPAARPAAAADPVVSVEEAQVARVEAPAPEPDLATRPYVRSIPEPAPVADDRGSHTSVFDVPRSPTSEPGSAGSTESGAALPPEAALGLPYLPKAAPAPPAVATAAPMPIPSAVPTIRNVKAQQHKRGGGGRLFFRAFLAIVLIGGVVAGALTFGRSLLFPVAWAPELTPHVDEIQREAQAEFDRTVALERQADDEYGETVVSLMFGDDWVSRVPEWRAAGLATGDVTAGSVAALVAAQRPAVYDPVADRIYMADVPESDRLDVELQRALIEAFQRDQAPASSGEPVAVLAGVSSMSDIARQAVDGHLAGSGELVPPEAAESGDATAVAGLPAPIAYELAATDRLGQAVLVGAGLDPETFAVGDELPADVGAVLSDEPAAVAAATLAPGEVAMRPAVALGSDDWSLVWGQRLPAVTVLRLADTVIADSYQVFDRGGTTCVAGVFETADASGGADVASALTQWASAGSPEAQASVTSLAPNVVQLISCDPGASSAVPQSSTAVDALVATQRARLQR